MRYRRLTFALAADREEPLSALLWSLGTLGLELAEEADGAVRVEAWFEDPLPAAAVGLLTAPGPLPGIELLASAQVAEADWMAAYRSRARPLRVGRRLVVDPRDRAPATPSEPGVWRLHLPARRAFGTGSHPSTSLVVRLMERLTLAGRSVLDLGTGTGILAFAALLAGAGPVVGLDRDLVAAITAADNARLNRLRPLLMAGRLDCLGDGRRFDVALVNVRPEHWRGDLPALGRLLRRPADAIFSGLIASEAGQVSGLLDEAGFRPAGRLDQEEWSALHVRLEA